MLCVLFNFTLIVNSLLCLVLTGCRDRWVSISRRSSFDSKSLLILTVVKLTLFSFNLGIITCWGTSAVRGTAETKLLEWAWDLEFLFLNLTWRSSIVLFIDCFWFESKSYWTRITFPSSVICFGCSWGFFFQGEPVNGLGLLCLSWSYTLLRLIAKDLSTGWSFMVLALRDSRLLPLLCARVLNSFTWPPLPTRKLYSLICCCSTRIISERSYSEWSRGEETLSLCYYDYQAYLKVAAAQLDFWDSEEWICQTL